LITKWLERALFSGRCRVVGRVVKGEFVIDLE
jgi:hypothetical protein